MHNEKIDLAKILKETSESVNNGHSIDKLKEVQELKEENDALKATLCDMGRQEWC